MTEEADNIIQPLVLGEGTVAAFMAKDPEAGANEALNETVGDPGGGPERKIVNARDESRSSPAGGGDENNVAGQIGQRYRGRRLEALLRDGLPEGVDIGERFFNR